MAGLDVAVSKELTVSLIQILTASFRVPGAVDVAWIVVAGFVVPGVTPSIRVTISRVDMFPPAARPTRTTLYAVPLA